MKGRPRASRFKIWILGKHQERYGGMMTPPRLIFLIGGSDAYEVMADEFLAAAGGLAARIALLLPDQERLALRLEHYSRRS